MRAQPGPADGVEARSFFTERIRAKELEAGISGVDLFGSEMAGQNDADGGASAASYLLEATPPAVLMSLSERADAEERLRRTHAVANLASAAVDAATPIVGSVVLRVRGGR